MHVAYVCSDLGVPIGGTKGASIHVRSLAQALCLRGHRVSLLAANPGDTRPVGFRPQIYPVGYNRTLKRLKKRLAKSNPNSTLDREVYALLLGNLAYRQLDRLHRDQPIDAVYERHSLWSWAALAFAHERGIPHVLEVNAPLVREQRAYRGLTMAKVAETCERELISRSDVVVVPSAALARHATRLGARSSAVHLLPNAIDPELFLAPPPLPRARRELLEGKFVVAFVGSLKPWHGIEVLLEAFARLARSTANAHLLVLGDGPLRGLVDQAAAELGPERVTAPGSVAHQAVPIWLRHADVGVAPYPRLADFYFSPMKVVEYQASGLAVVASDIGHLRNQIEHARTGLLVRPGDHIQLSEALARLARRPELAQGLGLRARRHVLEEHTWDQVAAKVEGLMCERSVSAPVAVAAAGDT